MSLRAVQIVVRAPSRAAFREALDRALRRQKPSPKPRRLTAALAGGWACLVEEGRADADAGLARLLSELLRDAVAVEVDGGALALRLRAFREGEPRLVPQDTALAGHAFADVEAVAWSALRELEVPAALRLVGPDAARAVAQDDAGGFEGIVAEIPAGAAAPILDDVQVLLPERREGEGPPAEPDLWVESAAGEECALMARTLPALVPDDATAQALAAIELAQVGRVAAHLAARTDEERISRVSFVYRTPKGRELAPRLDQARRAFPKLARFCDPGRPAPLSRIGFTRACRAALQRALPDLRVLRAHALRIEVATSDPAVTLRAPAAEAYAAYLAADSEPEAPAAALVEAVRKATSEPMQPLDALAAEELLRGLVPSVAVDGTEAAARRATAPLAGPLRAALLHDDGTRLWEVAADALAARSLSFEAALARAVENVEALTLAHPEGISWFDLDEGRVVVFDFDDPAGAGRVLSPQARSALNELLGEPCLCTVPTRDSLLACSMLEPDAIQWLEQESARRATEGPHGLAPTLLVVSRESVGPSTAGDLAASIRIDLGGEKT